MSKRAAKAARIPGTVRQRGRTWAYQFGWPGDDGARRLIQRGGHATEAEAWEAMRRHQDDLRNRRAVITEGRETVADYMRRWAESVEASDDLKPSTRAFYADMGRYVVSPTAGLARVRLSALEPSQIAGALGRLRERGGRDGRALSATTVHSIYRVFGQALREAVEEGAIATSPMDRLAKRQRPRKAKQSRAEAERHRWSTEEAARFVRAAVADESPDGLALALMVRLGLRRGEALGLRWRDVEETADGAVIHVRQNRVVVGGVVHVHSTKTDDSERTIPAGGIADDLLDLARRRQATDRLRAGECWEGPDALDPDGLVFRRKDGGDVHPQSIRHPLSRITKAAGITRQLSPHKLRHTAASVLVESGMDVITVASVMGHADASMILRLYAHADRRHVAAELRRVAEAVYGGAAVG